MDDSSSLTVKRYKSKPVARRTNINAHFCAHQLFDQIAQQKDVDDDDDDDDDELEDLKDEEADELLLADELIQDCDVDDDDDETKAWISSNREKEGEGEGECKPVMSVVTSSSSWNEDAYEKPSLVGAGLANLGNSCFFNAVMQCFSHSVLLVQGLYSQNHPTPCDCKASSSVILYAYLDLGSNERFCLICALREQVELSLTSSGKIVSPWKLFDNLSCILWNAHEFCNASCDRLEKFSNLILKVKDDAPLPKSDNLVQAILLRSTDTKVSEAKDHSSRSDAVGTLSPVNRVIKETTPLSLKQYGSNHRVETQKTANVTPTSQITFQSTFNFDHVLSPQTPPRSPGLDLSEDENTEVVFAAKPHQLKIAEKTSNKRQRGKDEDNSAKVEAAKMCRKMPGARGKMFMEAMSSKSDDILNKKSMKMSSPSRKNHRYQDPSFARKLATSSFR
ncbi:ubiquitin carboxyl-terminal hydrolase 20-like protein [Tanacetum coccineum]